MKRVKARVNERERASKATEVEISRCLALPWQRRIENWLMVLATVKVIHVKRKYKE